jgi:two-component system LytT family response regulator
LKSVQPAPDPIRVVVVDDELLALNGLLDLLRRDPELEVLKGCNEGRTAVKVIAEESPDLVLLDVQMPGMDGFTVLRELGADTLPIVVFVTAYDRYALQAFDACAIDYLLKPFSDERFGEAMRRAKRAVRERAFAGMGRRVAALLRTYDTTANPVKVPPRRIAVRVGARVHFIAVSDIDWIEGADYCAKIYGHLIRESRTSLAARLDAGVFFRAHRSAIINTHRVKEIHGSMHGEAVAVLLDGTKVRIARGRRATLEELLERGAQLPVASLAPRAK